MSTVPGRRPPARLRLPWPLPALLVWAAAWGLFAVLAQAGVDVLVALGCAAALGALGSVLGPNWWRRFMIALGFPLSLLVSGAVTLPGWVWLLPLGLVLLVYPINAWRDAPIFPTPRAALLGLPQAIALPAGAAVLDAGCGLGDGLRALRRAWPEAALHGLEWSWPLRLLCALRCPWAQGQRKAHSRRKGQLHSRPCSAASGQARRRARRPSPRPQPASSTAAPAGKAIAWGRPSKAARGVGKIGASRQALIG